jgi:hypothetical protein
MVQETRHIDFGGHTCGTLDRKISDMGAYGAQYYLMLWLGTHWSGATQAEKDYSVNRAELLRASAFCAECA